MDLLKRRQLMLLQEDSAGNLSNYVQDGLILHLDGKEKGNNAGKWTDVKNGYQYTNNGATFNSDHVYFDGVDDYLQGANPSNNAMPLGAAGSGTYGTIEVVLDFENLNIAAGTVFVPRGNSKIALYLGSTGSMLYAVDNASSRNYYYPISTLQKASWSISSVRRYENGSPMTLSTSKSYFSGVSTSYNLIGKRNNSSTPRFFKGKIYSIRIYNKQLTQAEVLQNLAVDNVRFNLGLTLT